MFRDEFDQGGVERMKSQVHLTFIFGLHFFQLSLCGEKEGKKRRGREEKERNQGTKEEKTTSYAYTLPYIFPIIRYFTLVLSNAAEHSGT